MTTTPTPQSDHAATTPGRAEELAAYLTHNADSLDAIEQSLREKFDIAVSDKPASSLRLREAAALLRAQSAELLALRAALSNCLSSATPHSEENPAMFRAWKAGRAALNSPTQKSPAK